MPIIISTSPFAILFINFVIVFEEPIKSDDKIANLAPGKASEASSASLSTPGPIGLKESDTPQFGQSSKTLLVSPH